MHNQLYGLYRTVKEGENSQLCKENNNLFSDKNAALTASWSEESERDRVKSQGIG